MVGGVLHLWLKKMPTFGVKGTKIFWPSAIAMHTANTQTGRAMPRVRAEVVVIVALGGGMHTRASPRLRLGSCPRREKSSVTFIRIYYNLLLKYNFEAGRRALCRVRACACLRVCTCSWPFASLV